MASYIVLLGPPGAGKGTQAKAIIRKMSIPHISSGEIFREQQRNKTELGLVSKHYIDKGELVPDDVTIAMVRERLQRADCQAGAILDGFPRTLAQAEAFTELLVDINSQVKAVPYINVPEHILVERLSGRWTCRAAGHVYHEKYNPPRVAGQCDLDGSELYQREDDKTETVIHRIRIYFKQTEPLIAYYRERGLLIEVDGSKPIEQVTTEILTSLQVVG
jgi:adenylate kinase